MSLNKLKFITDIEMASNKNIIKKITNYDDTTAYFNYADKRDQEELLYNTMALLSGIHENEIELIPRGLTAVNCATARSEAKTSTCVVAVLPWSIKQLKDQAFYGYEKLKTIYFPELLNQVGEQAFANCKSLSNLTIPERASFVGKGAFEGCDNIVSLSIPMLGGFRANENTSDACLGFYFSKDIDTTDFTHAEQSSQYDYVPKVLKNIYITNGSVIASYAFNGLKHIEHVKLNEGIESIGHYAFQGCYGMTELIIPDSVNSIYTYAFNGCYGLTELKLPPNITSVKSGVFKGCYGLTSINIPDGVTSIGNEAFYGCTGLTEIAIPEGVTTIGNSAFYNCTGLTGIAIPASVTDIGSFAFSRCSGLNYITVEDSNTVYSAVDNCLIKDKTLITGCKNSEIPTDGSVTAIGESAFSYCTGLTSITIPGSITSIGDLAFCQCTKLTDIYYMGTESQWKAITKTDGSWNSGMGTYTIHYNQHPGEHNYKQYNVVNPTCTTKGYTTYRCACGDRYNGNYVNALGHNYEATVTAPTCTSNGYTTHICSRCSKSYVDSYVPATGHTFGQDITKPTCTTYGYTTYICSCGHTEVGDIKPALGHEYVQKVLQGKIINTCIRCKDSYEGVLM